MTGTDRPPPPRDTRALTVLYVLGLVGTLGLGGVWVASVQAVEQDSMSLQESLADLAHVRMVTQLLADAERLQRGYLLTRKRDLHDRFVEAVMTLERELVRLEATAGRDPGLRPETDLLDDLFRSRVALLYRALEGAEVDGVESVAGLLQQGHELMIQAEGQAERTAQLLEGRISERSASLAARGRMARAFAVGLALLGAAFLWLTFATARRHLAARDRARQELEALASTLEQRVEERTLALERTNQQLAAALEDMEAFSYSVSHDLRAPVRALHGHGALLTQDDCDAARARDVGARVRATAGRMAAIIDGLLDLSRAARKELALERVEVASLANEVLAELARASPERRVEVEVGAGVPVWGDAALLRLLVVNVIENAWKYTARQEQARVQIAALRTEDGEGFVIRDNGVGFDMKLAPKVFEPFERLHAASEFPGSGIGLAIVRRIVKRHGGRIWVESAPGAGAAFYVVLPDGQMARG